MTSVPAGPAAGRPPRPREPFRGIEPFRYLDQRIFFAREEERQSLNRRVTLYRGVLLYGESGTGKSSLVNAGFIPAAIADGFAPERLRLQPRDGEEFVVERIPLAGGETGPYLRSNLAGDEAPRSVLSARDFLASLRRLPSGERPLLIFDQFEEFVTLFEEAATRPAAGARRSQEQVLETLVEVLRDGTMPAKVLFVFREDYLAKLSSLFALCPDLPDQYLRLRPPCVAALPKLIRGPFETFPGQFGTELSQGLAAALAQEFARRSESGFVNLSEVQIACLKLWRSGSPEDFFKAKGVEGLLEEHLSEALDQFGPLLRDPALALLTHMVTSSGTRNVVSMGDLLSLVRQEEHFSLERLETALDALRSDAGLVRHELRRETHYYELVSEFLIPKIQREKETRARRIARAERRKKLAAYALAAVCLALLLLSFDLYRRNILHNEVIAALRAKNAELSTGKKPEQRSAWETLFGIYEKESQAMAVVALTDQGWAMLPRDEILRQFSTRLFTRRKLEIRHSAEGFDPEVEGLWRALGFQVDATTDGTQRRVELTSVQTIVYNPKSAGPEDIREVALGMIYAGHGVRLILRDEGFEAGVIRIVDDKRSKDCPEMHLADIIKARDFGTQPDSLADTFSRCREFGRSRPGATPTPTPTP